MKNLLDEKVRVIVVWILFILVLVSSGVLLENRLRVLTNGYICQQVAEQAELAADLTSNELYRVIDDLIYISRFIEDQESSNKHTLEAVASDNGHESMGLQALSGEAVSGTALSVRDFPSIQDSFRGNAEIGFVPGRGLIFTCPVFHDKNVKYVVYKLLDDVAMRRNIAINSADNRRIVITTKDGEVIMPFSDVTENELKNFSDPVFVHGFEDLYSRMDFSASASDFFTIGKDRLIFFVADIPNTKFRIQGYMPVERMTEGIYGVAYLTVFVFGFMLVLFAIGTLYLIVTAEKASESDELRLAKQKADEANKAKSDFLASMSHEIRTPINAVLGMDEMIIRESDNDHILEYASHINNAAKSLLGLINDILDFSKIEAGKMEIIPRDYKPSFMISDLVSMTSVRAHNKDLGFVVHADPALPTVLNGDEDRVKQCILNILTNAVKYTEKGSVTFTISGERVSDKEIVLSVSVRDTGIGIKEADIKRLFSPFERVDVERNRSIEGTGLGLSIVKNLLNMMGTSLEVESEYGKGSVFSFKLKQGVSDWSAMGDYAEDYKKSISSQSKYRELFRAPDARILVVDDTEMNLTVFKGLLKKTRIQIDTASNGPDAIELVKKNKYDILFIDHRMPGMDGVETLKIMREMTDNLSADAPCIAFTANAGAGSKDLYRSYGFNDYLSKPVSPAELEEIIYKLLPSYKIEMLIEEELSEEESNAKDEEYDVFREVYKNADDLNYFVALAGCGNDEILRDTAITFFKTIDSRADEIERFEAEGDIENYTIRVHALKSSARLVGAVALSKKAEYLEKCGNEHNIEEIRNLNKDLLSDYRALKESMQEIFNAFRDTLSEKERSEVSNEDKEALSEGRKNSFLTDIRNAVGEFDFDGVINIVKLMREYRIDPELEKKLEAITEAAEDLDDERIEELLG